MIQKMLQFIVTSKDQIIKYVVVGGSGVILDIGTLTLLKEYAGIAPVAAVVINQAFMMAYVFLLNKYWSFKNKDIPTKQLLRYLILMAVNYAIAIGAMYLFHNVFGYEYRLVRIASIALMTLWNFPLYKFWVYRTSSEPKVQSQEVEIL